MEEGYIVEFSIGCSESYSHVEAIFEEGPIKIFLAYIPFFGKDVYWEGPRDNEPQNCGNINPMLRWWGMKQWKNM